MFCPSCGAPTEATARFCRSCGTQLSSETAIGPQPPTLDPPSPPETKGDRFEPYPTAPPPPFAAPIPYQGGSDPSAPRGAPLATFGLPLAGWWQRVASMLLDALVLLVPIGILDGSLSAAFATNRVVLVDGAFVRVHDAPPGVALTISLVSFLVGALYFVVLNGRGSGQTIGNRAPGIAVRDVRTGEVIGLGRGLLRLFIRVLLYSAFFIPGVVNDLFPLWDPRHQTIADKAARSVVIRLAPR